MHSNRFSSSENQSCHNTTNKRNFRHYKNIKDEKRICLCCRTTSTATLLHHLIRIYELSSSFASRIFSYAILSFVSASEKDASPTTTNHRDRRGRAANLRFENVDCFSIYALRGSCSGSDFNVVDENQERSKRGLCLPLEKITTRTSSASPFSSRQTNSTESVRSSETSKCGGEAYKEWRRRRRKKKSKYLK